MNSAAGSSGISPLRAAMMGQVSSLQGKLYEAQAKLENNQHDQVYLLASQSQLRVDLAEARAREKAAELQAKLDMREEMDESRAEGMEAREHELKQMGAHKAKADMQERMTALYVEHVNGRADEQELRIGNQARMHQESLQLQSRVALHGVAMGGSSSSSSKMAILRSFHDDMPSLQQPQPQPGQPQAARQGARFCGKCANPRGSFENRFCSMCAASYD